MVCISHDNYDLYSALYLVAITTGIAVLLVPGWHAHSSLIPVATDIIDPCLSNVFDDLAHTINGSPTKLFNILENSISN